MVVVNVVVTMYVENEEVSVGMETVKEELVVIVE